MIKNSLAKTKFFARGFTLVEMLVYLAIFMVVSVASVGFLLSLNKFIDQYQLETLLYRSGTNAMEQIMLAIRQADQVDLVNTIEDDPDNGKLTVENSTTVTEFTYDSVTGTIDLDINGTDYGDLNSDRVSVDDFTVYYYDMAIGEFVRVRLTLTATLNTGTTKSITLYGGAIIRGAI